MQPKVGDKFVQIRDLSKTMPQELLLNYVWLILDVRPNVLKFENIWSRSSGFVTNRRPNVWSNYKFGPEYIILNPLLERLLCLPQSET